MKSSLSTSILNEKVNKHNVNKRLFSIGLRCFGRCTSTELLALSVVTFVCCIISWKENTILNTASVTLPTIRIDDQQHQQNLQLLGEQSSNDNLFASTTKMNIRVLMGIFSADSKGDVRYRNAFRDLLKLHPNVCTLHDWMEAQIRIGNETNNTNTNDKIIQEQCELIYTFVLGGNPHGPQEIVTNEHKTPVLVQERPKSSLHSPDITERDMTFLNIRENMNDGKSQTWLYYASTVMENHNIEYVMKIDTDSVLYLDRFFIFAALSLPPSPYNTNIIAGAPVDKVWWKIPNFEQSITETFFKEYYNNLHFYVAGQMYILSKDLASGVAHVAATMPEARDYIEKHEDHDISMFAFLSVKSQTDNPIKYIMIPYDNPFWLHPVKLKTGIGKWKKTWDDEINRMKTLFPPPQITADNATSFIPTTIDQTADTGKRYQPRTIFTHRNDVDDFVQNLRIEWINLVKTFNVDDIVNNMTDYDIVQIDNSIAPPKNTIIKNQSACFLQSGHLDRHMRVVEVSAEGGMHWSALASLIKLQTPDAEVIILNQMDIGMTRSDLVHTTHQLALKLSMNYAWGMEFVQFSSGDGARSGEIDQVGFTGQAILSKCKIYDPFIVRNKKKNVRYRNFSRVGGPVGLFVRTGNEDAMHYNNDEKEAHHIVLGSLHKFDPDSERVPIWEYLFGHSSFRSLDFPIPPRNQIGSIIGGIMHRDVCKKYGLQHLDRQGSRKKTWPATCDPPSTGKEMVDVFCGNLVLYKFFGTQIHRPCQYVANVVQPIQISTHSIISIQVH